MTSKEALEKLSYIPIYEEDIDIIFKGDLCELHRSEIDAISKDLDVLEEYKKIEKELGIELTVLFKALKNGVYYFDEQGQLIHDYVWLVNDYIADGVPDKLSFSFKTYHSRQVLLFEDYGKFWAVYKQELPGEQLDKLEQMTYLQEVLIEGMNEFCSEKFDLSYERTQEEANEYINKNIEEYRSLTTHNWY